jgi:redox-sensing transcriptional repressor
MLNVKLSSLPSIKRLPSYLHVIEAFQRDGREYISGTLIADELELESIQVRKDLALTGIVGRPRLGFHVAMLIEAINRYLDWHNNHRAIVVGAGHLGTALIGYSEFARHGMQIVAAFDANPSKIGQTLMGVPILSLLDLAATVEQQGVELAILTVPSASAQELCDILVGIGITAIWNFTNVKLKVPKHVVVQKEDLSSGYAVLSVKMAKSKTASRA